MTTATIKPDSQIKTEIQAELDWDPALKGCDLAVQVSKGIVTLSGEVSAFALRLAARDAAHHVGGALDVVDHMHVVIPPHAQRRDEQIAAAVRHALEWDVLVPDDQIQSTVTDGVITLEGSVNTLQQRNDADRAVHRLVGVRGVINHIRIVGPRVTPSQIKTEIEEALERRAHREAKHIRVDVKDDIVTLTGTVHSWGERNSVARTAGYALGVRKVDDRLTVDPYL